MLGTRSSEHNPHFEALFLPQLDAAYNLARWIVGGDQDAQEIVQEAYLRAQKEFSRFRGDNPRAWLLTIVRDTAHGWIKKKHLSKGTLVSLDEEMPAAPVPVAPSDQSHESKRATLEKALHRLPPEFREVLVLFELESWSYQAIAAALEVPLETVMSRLSKARRHLLAALTGSSPSAPSP